MTRPHPLSPILLTPALATAAVLFIGFALLPTTQTTSLTLVAWLAAGLWAAAAWWAARPLIGYATRRHRLRGVRRSE